MQVFVTPRAERNFESIVNYIKDKWGEGTAKQLVQKTDDTFKLLKSYPSMDRLKKATSEDFNFHLTQGSFIELETKRLLSLHFLMYDKTQRKKVWLASTPHNNAYNSHPAEIHVDYQSDLHSSGKRDPLTIT